jgi:serine/threonine-protein kinase
VGEARDYHFIELEYVPGESLQHLRVEKNEFTPLDATRYLVQSCDALAAAHRQGMVHRDFKPANILVRQDGVAKLADFGLAKRVVVSPPTVKRRLNGTPYFMAPELFSGKHGSTASDVYAVGVSYYYLLTGKFPFTSKNLVKLWRLHEEQPVPDPRELAPAIPAAVADVVLRALAKRPEQRYRDGDELHADLLSVLTTLKSLRSIVEEAVEGLDAAVAPVDDRLAVLVDLPNGRRQTVYVEEAMSEPWSTTIVRVYSICGPADESYFRHALVLNAQIPHGSLAIEDIDGTSHFVMLQSYLRATCDPPELRHGIEDISRWADDVERALTGDDRY